MTKTLRRGVVALIALGLLGAVSCTPSTPAGPSPDPVIIAAGTFGPQVAYEPMAQRLRAGGRQVFIYVIPVPINPLEQNSAHFAAYVNQVLGGAGRAKVDTVAHSQSGLLARYALKHLGLATKVDTLVSLSGVQYGSALANLGVLVGGGNCLGIISCQQVAQGSAFLRDLNEPNDAVPGVHYVNITTIFEEVVVPYTNNLMYGTGDITNVVIQDQCPLRVLGHLLLAVDGTTASGIDDALSKRPITLNCFAI